MNVQKLFLFILLNLTIVFGCHKEEQVTIIENHDTTTYTNETPKDSIFYHDFDPNVI